MELAFMDDEGDRLEVHEWPHHSSVFGEYIYLRAKENHPRRTGLIVTAPDRAVMLKLSGHTWSDYTDLSLMKSPRLILVDDSAPSVGTDLGGEVQSGIVLAGVNALHHVPFDTVAVTVEVPVQGNLRPAQQILTLRFLDEAGEELAAHDIGVESRAGYAKVKSDPFRVPHDATSLRLQGPSVSCDNNPVTLTRLPGLHWHHEMPSSDGTASGDGSGGEPPAVA
ncbi:MAG: hypothetical protein ACTHX1_03960 [Micrococcaceae bacterium]